jgi:dihydrofolate reductase
MRKIIAGEFISLDEVIDVANDLTSQYASDEFQQYLQSGMPTTDTLLMGRVTYQEMAPFWAPTTGSDDPVAAHMSKPKYVVSTTLDDPSAWPNSTLINGDVAGQLTRLKEQPGKDILVIGSATLVRWPLREGLLDQLDLLVFPVVVATASAYDRLHEAVADHVAAVDALEGGNRAVPPAHRAPRSPAGRVSPASSPPTPRYHGKRLPVNRRGPQPSRPDPA